MSLFYPGLECHTILTSAKRFVKVFFFLYGKADPTKGSPLAFTCSFFSGVTICSIIQDSARIVHGALLTEERQ